MRYVLIKSRHRHKDIQGLPAIFNIVTANQVLDFDYHKRIVHKKLENYKYSELHLYVTGLTPVLVSVINYCRLFNIPVVLYHYNTRTNTYVRQSVV